MGNGTTRSDGGRGAAGNTVTLMREDIEVVDTPSGLRARDPLSHRVIHPGPVWQHLLRAFGAILPSVHGAMALLAA